MANDGKIYITISDTRGGSGGNKDDSKSKNKKQTLQQFARHKFFDLIQSEAKTLVNYTVGNIGNFTGNYQMQRDIQNVMSGLSFAINIGTAAYVGSKFGLPGIAVAASSVLISEGVKSGLQIKSDMFENRKMNRNIEYMRNRLGLEGLTNGGRTGGY